MPEQTFDIIQDPEEALLFCAKVSAHQVTESTCRGICPNPDISGIGFRISTYFLSAITTLTLMFIRDHSERCIAYILQGVSCLSMILAAIIFGTKKAISQYHALQLEALTLPGFFFNGTLILYGGVPRANGSLNTTVNWLMAVTLLSAVGLWRLAKRSNFGSQPSCNEIEVPLDPFLEVALLTLYAVGLVFLPLICLLRTVGVVFPKHKDAGPEKAALVAAYALFYGTWIATIEIAEHTNRPLILGESEREMSPGQVLSILFAVASVIPPVKAIYWEHKRSTNSYQLLDTMESHAPHYSDNSEPSKHRHRSTI